MKWLVVFIAIVIGDSAAVASETMPYGSRVGMELTIVSADGLDTDHAEIHAVHERSEAVKFCREYENDKSTRCINNEIKSIPSFVYRANCETGVFGAVGGRYRFVGPAKDDPDGMMIAFQVIGLDTGEDLDGSEASGYPQAMEVFKHLCPSKAPGDLYKNQ